MRNTTTSPAEIERVKARQLRLMAEGKCRICGKPNPRVDRNLCGVCAAKNIRTSRAAYAARKRRGQCTSCEAAAIDGNKCRRCALEAQLRQRARYALLRHAAIDHYGGKCDCCGEDNPCFMVFDHIDGGGGLHRCLESLPRWNMGLWLKKMGYPDYIRLLCANCNHATKDGHACPHQVLRGEPTDE